MPDSLLPADEFARLHVRPRPGRTLVVGSRVCPGRLDRRAAYADAVGLDMQPGIGVDVVHDLDAPIPARLGIFDHVECWSVLEHVRRPWRAAKHIERVMRPGSSIHLSVPFVWRVHAYPSDYWRFTPDGVRELFGSVWWRAICMAGTKLRRGNLVTSCTPDGEGGLPYFVRTEVLGFGFKRENV